MAYATESEYPLNVLASELSSKELATDAVAVANPVGLELEEEPESSTRQARTSITPTSAPLRNNERLVI
jgi:hypothetical protein